MLASALDLVDAALDGRYSERVKEGDRPRHPKVVATWTDADGARHEAGLNTFLGVLNDDNSEVHHYLPTPRCTTTCRTAARPRALRDSRDRYESGSGLADWSWEHALSLAD